MIEIPTNKVANSYKTTNQQGSKLLQNHLPTRQKTLTEPPTNKGENSYKAPTHKGANLQNHLPTREQTLTKSPTHKGANSYKITLPISEQQKYRMVHLAMKMKSSHQVYHTVLSWQCRKSVGAHTLLFSSHIR